MVWNSWMGCVPIRPGTANWISMVWSNLPWYWWIVFAFKMMPIPDPRNHWQQKQGSSSSHTFYQFSLHNWRIFLIFSTFKISKLIIHVSLRSIQESCSTQRGTWSTDGGACGGSLCKYVKDSKSRTLELGNFEGILSAPQALVFFHWTVTWSMSVVSLFELWI